MVHFLLEATMATRVQFIQVGAALRQNGLKHATLISAQYVDSVPHAGDFVTLERMKPDGTFKSYKVLRATLDASNDIWIVEIDIQQTHALTLVARLEKEGYRKTFYESFFKKDID
jgi:hypothetical protein